MPTETTTAELEKGDIFFFYRPRVGLEEVHALEEVQRFFFVLAPDGESRLREIVIGTKRLPDPERHERAWAFVARVSDDAADLRAELLSRRYQTKTRAERVQPEARPAGEGRYALVEHRGHSHIAYVLQRPARVGEAQRTLRIEPQASFIVAVRNPEAPAPPQVGRDTRRRALPPSLQTRFKGRRFAPVDTPEWLDCEGVELVVIGAARAAERELGLELDGEAERAHDADLFAVLRLEPGELPVEPLKTGRLT